MHPAQLGWGLEGFGVEPLSSAVRRAAQQQGSLDSFPRDVSVQLSGFIPGHLQTNLLSGSEKQLQY